CISLLPSGSWGRRLFFATTGLTDVRPVNKTSDPALSSRLTAFISRSVPRQRNPPGHGEKDLTTLDDLRERGVSSTHRIR
ncbi:MAG: hypothetical protein AAFW01_13665, partial [Pseudomonadota bacterium]